MRYYNENPQVTLWREKFENLEMYNSEMELCFKTLLNDSVMLRREVENFNSLPWYKKMFYKFKL